MHGSELARNGPDSQVHHLPRAYDDGLPSSAIRSLQFRILYFFLYWRLTRLDFAATTTLPPDLYDGLDPTPAASVLAYTDSCTNAAIRR